MGHAYLAFMMVGDDGLDHRKLRREDLRASIPGSFPETETEIESFYRF
jgi:hypothetical protein